MAFLNQEGKKIDDYLENRKEPVCFRETTVCLDQTGSEETLAMPVQQ